MAPLKENLRYHLKKHHQGKANQITIHDLVRELFPIKTHVQEIRQAIRDLCIEGFPIIITPESPAHIYFVRDDEELAAWAEAMLNLCEDIWQRKSEIERSLKMTGRARLN